MGGERVYAASGKKEQQGIAKAAGFKNVRIAHNRLLGLTMTFGHPESAAGRGGIGGSGSNYNLSL